MKNTQNTNVRTQKFLIMKNFNTASLKTLTGAVLTAFCLILFTPRIDAQVSVVIDTPMDGDSHCQEFQDLVTFDATGFDGMNPILDANISWEWSGPNGFSSTAPSPQLVLDTTLYDGDYYVTATFASGETAVDMISLNVDPTIDWECPETIFVTPDLDDPLCAKNLTFDGFEIDQVNCTSLSYTWDISLTSQGGMDLPADPMTLPMSYAIDNTLFNQTYGAGIYYPDIPFGFHELRIDILNGVTIIDQCLVEVRVVESRGNLACNDLINMTLDGDCSATITPDMILEGEYCFDLFELTVEEMETGLVTQGIGSLMINAPGMYNVTVTGQTGISCWGQIFAEDKSAPILECEDVEMYCSTLGTAPGSEIRGFDRGWLIDETIASGDTELFLLDLPDIAGTITEVVVNVQAEMENVSDLEMSLTSPEGTTVLLLDLADFSSPCENSNLSLCLRDDADQSYAMLGSPELCRSTKNALLGTFEPYEAFSAFNGELANDLGTTTWQLEVTHGSGSSEDIVITELDLQVYTIEGYLLTSSDVIESNGCSDDQSFLYEDEQIGTNCEEGYWQHIIRTWIVTNSASGLSASCEQNIYLKQWTVDEIIWPKSYDDIHQPALRCDELDEDDVDENGVPTPERTGEPRVPFGELCGNFQVTHDDLTFDICGPLSKKTIRTWAILDWCTGDIVQYDQTIKVIDDSPIVFSCVPDQISPADAAAIGYSLSEESYIVNSNPYTCDGNWEIVFPLVFDNACDDELTIEVYYLIDDDEDPDDAPVDGVYIQNNIVDENGVQINNFASTGVPHTITNLPVGRRTWIKMVATDECGNTGECFTEVDIEDTTNPLPVCIEYTVAAFGETGTAKVHAISLDNGSWDNCGVVKYEIKEANASDFQYTDTWEFYCNCSNPNRIMHLRVSDAAGNSNTCEVEVELQDNLPPVQTGEPQRYYTFECDESPVDISSIIDESLDDFSFVDNCRNVGGLNNEISLNVSVVNPTQAYAPFESSGCGVGSRNVTYEVRDECGELLTTFSQIFDFTNSSINNPSTFDVTRWPQDLELSDCTSFGGLEPHNLSSAYNHENIIVNTSECNDIAIGWDDVIFTEVDDACLKILRTWTVIDWCIADRQGVAAGTREHTQVIKVDDVTAPNIDVTSSIVIDSKSETCYTSTDTTALVADITDACTDMFEIQDIEYHYSIAYADGTNSGIRTGNDANGSYPFGTSVITWYALDHCGNETERTTNVIVRDTKAPTPYCLGSVVTATMNTDGTAEIWASDFDLGGYDNYTGNAACNNYNELDIYFIDGNFQTDFLIFDCTDIPNGISQMIPLEVYYEDEYGNTDFCMVTLLLQDNESDQCEDMVGSNIGGFVHTENSEMLENVRVTMKNTTLDFTSLDITDENGYYAFENVPTNTNYTVKSEMEDDPLNGVSTLDLVLIQRHILGLSYLNSPYKIIAADADNSGNVSAIDLLTIRKLILGITEEFPNGQQAWRFPDEGQTFLDPEFPFPYSEEIEIFNMAGDMLEQDFVAVKIGDVNASAQLDFQGVDRQSEKRSAAKLTLEIDEQSLFKGERTNVAVYAPAISNVLGFQNTINFNSSVMEFVGVESAGLDISEENLGLTYLEDGIISLSWNGTESQGLYEDDALFNLIFDVKEDAQLSDQIYLSSDLTKAEAYDQDLGIMDLNIKFKGQELEDFVLYQNTPNPFLETTDIRFKLPYNSNVVFTVYDVTGRELLREKSNLDAGLHTIRLTADQLNSTGVMYYKIETDYGTDSRKMIQIR